MSLRIAFKTFGCKANAVDTDVLYLEAVRRGYQVVNEEERADAYVVNSCTVTQNADKDARIQLLKFKRQNPLALVGVVGCYAQVAREELLNLPEVDFVVGTADKLRILDLFSRASQGEKSLERNQVSPTTGFLPVEFRGSRHARASVKVQDGCNFKCSFCIIPEARGRSRSLALGEVVAQVEEAHHQGFHEVVLTGIHLAHYGWDRGTDLQALLRRLLSTPEGPRLRLTTLDPFEIPRELVKMLSEFPRLCPHFHIALQSGSDSVLKNMRRIYKASEFIDSTIALHDENSDVFIGVDVIVGFPGETEEDFAMTLKTLNESPWSKLHVFPFSVRKGTKAETLPGKVDPAAIHRRAKILRELSEERYQAFLRSQLGKNKDVLLEKDHGEFWTGHTENYIPVRLATEKSLGRKSIVVSKLTGICEDRMAATAVIF